MKKIYSILFVLILLSSNYYGQSIYVAESVTENNEAIGAKNNWDIDPWGRSLYIVYDNGSPIKKGILYLFIDKFVEGSFQPHDSKVIEIEESTQRINYDYKFKDIGKFKIYFVNEDQETLSSMLLTLKTGTGNTNNENAAESENYYDNVKLIFCEKVLVGGTPLGIVKNVSLSKTDGWLYLKISHYAPLNSNIIKVDFWSKENTSFDFDQYVESKKYQIDPTWPDTFFKYQFTKPGRYKIVIYNEFDAIMKTGYITVIR
ncbi:MAG: hypothetical protein ABFS12_05795 [Bacteroidota bacterium]